MSHKVDRRLPSRSIQNGKAIGRHLIHGEGFGLQHPGISPHAPVVEPGAAVSCTQLVRLGLPAAAVDPHTLNEEGFGTGGSGKVKLHRHPFIMQQAGDSMMLKDTHTCLDASPVFFPLRFSLRFQRSLKSSKPNTSFQVNPSTTTPLRSSN